MSFLSMWNKFYKGNDAPSYPLHIYADFADKNLTFKGKVLDIGCGGGRNVAFLAASGYNVYGIDYTQTSVDMTRQRLKMANLTAKIEVGDVRNMPYQNDFFDAIFCYGVLCYCDKVGIKHGINEIYRILKPNAKAHLQVRNLNDFRYLDAKKTSKYTAISNPSFAKQENEYEMYYFDENEIFRKFNKFKEIKIDDMIRTYDNGRKAISYYLITVTK